MKILRECVLSDYDLGIWGLGFESRAIAYMQKLQSKPKQSFALGYTVHTNEFSYKKNKKYFSSEGVTIVECDDDLIDSCLTERFGENLLADNPINAIVDITVMSRHRLACVILKLLDLLPKDSTLTIVYSQSVHVPPPSEEQPIKILREIHPKLIGALGDISLPTSVIFGLGYEKNKALGVANYLDVSHVYALIPQSTIPEFEKNVRENNKNFLGNIPDDSILTYDIRSPFSTYLELKALIRAIQQFSRPLVVPLGPKMLSAIAVLIGYEMYPNLPVWRVSSEHTETPVDRPASGVYTKFTARL